MNIYLVGGAVRDQLLGLPVYDKDYLVVGASPEQMLEQGYTQVGKDFPVFLHPDSGEEYALARTERKQGQGYTGFICDFGPQISLDQDLQRRDLTINAMAQSSDGQLFDPYGGQADLDARLLRHVSPAFSEDPLRVLRVARFYARFQSLGFSVAEETKTLMRQMCSAGEMRTLTPERVWKEIEKSLMGPAPQHFFRLLREVGALKDILPELHALYGVPGPAKWHPEIDTGIHLELVMEQATKLSDQLPVRFAALCHDFGKALTPPERWPSHHGHGQLGMAAIRECCERLRVPNECRDLALLVSDLHCKVHSANELRPQTVIQLLDSADAWRKPDRFEQLLLTCIADLRGRTGFEHAPYPQADYLRQVLRQCNEIAVGPIIEAGFKGPHIRDELKRQRVALCADIKQGFWSQG